MDRFTPGPGSTLPAVFGYSLIFWGFFENFKRQLLFLTSGQNVVNSNVTPLLTPNSDSRANCNAT